MQEISEHVYIERAFPGVTLGAVNWPHGLILIDAPFRADDVRSWRAALFNLGASAERMMVNLDVHADRTLGARAMECTVVGHEQIAQVFRNRPVTFKAQAGETGADWELYNGLGSIRWAPPEITFTEVMQIYWNEKPLALEYHPGPSTGAIWVVIPDQKVGFIGDTVVVNQPPFLANADIPAWLETLALLQSPRYQDYTLVSGRSGLVTQKDVQQQIDLLKNVQQKLAALVETKSTPEDTAVLIPDLLKKLAVNDQDKERFTTRLKWGLSHYYTRHFLGDAEEIDA